MKLIPLLTLLAATTLANSQEISTVVTQSNIQKTICVSGYTKTVRPPVSYTNSIKHSLLSSHNIPWSKASDYELDHIIPLELGGHPSNPKNIQLQAWTGTRNAHQKDVLETSYKKKVCAGTLTLKQAQDYFANNWVLEK